MAITLWSSKNNGAGLLPTRRFKMSDPATDFANLPTQSAKKAVITDHGVELMYAGTGSEADAKDLIHPCALDSAGTWDRLGWSE